MTTRKLSHLNKKFYLLGTFLSIEDNFVMETWSLKPKIDYLLFQLNQVMNFTLLVM